MTFIPEKDLETQVFPGVTLRHLAKKESIPPAECAEFERSECYALSWPKSTTCSAHSNTAKPQQPAQQDIELSIQV